MNVLSGTSWTLNFMCIVYTSGLYFEELILYNKGCEWRPWNMVSCIKRSLSGSSTGIYIILVLKSLYSSSLDWGHFSSFSMHQIYATSVTLLYTLLYNIIYNYLKWGHLTNQDSWPCPWCPDQRKFTVCMYTSAYLLYVDMCRPTYTLFPQVPLVIVDSIYYGKFVLTPLNILLYNVFGKGGPDLYGRYWYWQGVCLM